MKTKSIAQAILLLSISGLVCADDTTRDAAIGGAAGGAIGGAIGSEVGGRDGAIIGSAMGAAIGTSVATEDNDQAHHVDHHHDGVAPSVNVEVGNHSSHFCPPGQAKKGRC